MKGDGEHEDQPKKLGRADAFGKAGNHQQRDHGQSETLVALNRQEKEIAP